VLFYYFVLKQGKIFLLCISTKLAASAARQQGRSPIARLRPLKSLI
jgi:hypothetical protein